MKIKVSADRLIDECLEYAIRYASHRCFKHDEGLIGEYNFLIRVESPIMDAFWQRWAELVGPDE